MRALRAIQAVFSELQLADVSDDRLRSVAAASGSHETNTFTPGEVTRISRKIRDSRLTAIDLVRALAARGFRQEAENVLFMLHQRVRGDYLQTSSILRDGKVVNALNDPNDYRGPGSGYRMTAERWQHIQDMRRLTTRQSVLEAAHRTDAAEADWLNATGPAHKGADPGEVVIGVSPAFGNRLQRTTANHDLIDVLIAIIDGIRDRGGTPRIVRFRHTADTSFLGLSAARLSGSGYGIGIQAKGTAVIHRADRLPHFNIELFSNSPVTTLDHYRRLGRNAADYAWGRVPEPIVVPVDGQALSARYHVLVSLLHAIETAMVDRDAAPVELVVNLGQDRR
jgi:propanediol dehydratase large subunit